MAKAPIRDTSRAERILGMMFITSLGISVLCFIAVMLAPVFGVSGKGSFDSGAWPFIVILPLVGLPLAFLFLIALFIFAAVRRSRATKKSL